MTVRRQACRAIFAGASFLALAQAIDSANAGGLAIREQSAVGQGMSFAGEGTPGMGLSAMFWNPAAVTQAQGLWSESHAALFMPHSTINAGLGTTGFPAVLPPNSGNIGEVAIIPSSYFAYRVNPNFYLGLAVSAPFGSATESNFPWAGQQLANVAKVKSIDANVILGWKANDQLSFAAGPRVVYVYDGRFTRHPLPTPFAGVVAGFDDLHDFGYGFTAGLTYTPTPLTEIALGYRSRVKVTLEGEQNVTPNIAIGGVRHAPASAPVTLPDQVNFGVRQRITDKYTALGTVEWTNWSVLQVSPVTAPIPATLTFNYRDGWFFALGGEYELNPQTTLRAGVAYEISPVTDRFRDTFLPDDNRWWFSAGLTYKFNEKTTLDFGYSFVWLGDSPINVVPGHPDWPQLLGGTLVGESKTYNHILSAALRYKWSVDAPPAAPRIVK